MLERERLAVHRVGQDRVRVPRLVQRQAPLEADPAALGVHLAAVGAAEAHLDRARAHAGAIQDLGQRHAAPLRGAHRAELPPLARDRRDRRACGRCRRTRASPPRSGSAGSAGRAGSATSGRSTSPDTVRRKVGGVEIGDREVVAHVEARGRHDDAADQLGQRRLAVERMGAVDDQARRRSRPGTSPRGRASPVLPARERRAAPAARDHPGAGGGGIDVERCRPSGTAGGTRGDASHRWPRR